MELRSLHSSLRSLLVPGRVLRLRVARVVALISAGERARARLLDQGYMKHGSSRVSTRSGSHAPVLWRAWGQRVALLHAFAFTSLVHRRASSAPQEQHREQQQRQASPAPGRGNGGALCRGGTSVARAGGSSAARLQRACRAQQHDDDWYVRRSRRERGTECSTLVRSFERVRVTQLAAAVPI